MEKVFFDEINDKKIFCILSEPENDNKKLVIMSHGFRGDTTGPARTFVDFSRQLVKSGYSVLRFDQPNSGNSDGQFLDSSFKEWVRTIETLTQKYLDQGYKVMLLGQSMGATATMIAAGSDRLINKVPSIILWVPDPEEDGIDSKDPTLIMEEGGEKIKVKFWLEAHDLNFFDYLDKYPGGIHLVFGETDKYVSRDQIDKTVKKVTEKGQEILVLPGQDHSPWSFDIAQDVYLKEIEFLNKYN